MDNNDFNIRESLENGLDKLFGLLPEIIGFILLILLGWVLAKIAKRAVVMLLRKIRFERSITLSPAGNYVTRVIEHPTAFVGKIAYWIVFLAFVSFALSALGVPAITQIVNGIYAYIPNVIAAVIIFLVASAITAGAEAFVFRVLAPGAMAKLLGAIIPAIIMPIAIFMILNQLHIAEDIVNITYTALVGSVALGLALAFGLGGRDVAGRILEQAYNNAQDNSDQIKAEVTEAKRRAARQAKTTRSTLES